MLSERPKQSHTLDLLVILSFTCPHVTVARNPDKHLNFDHFVSFFGLTIKTPYIVHKNVSVYCVEF